MRSTVVRTAGFACAVAYGAFIVWVYAQQPQNVDQVTGGLQAGVGLYAIDRVSFEEAVAYFHDDRFPEARISFERADPARRDPATQFYIAYSYYRQGWGRLYHDDELYRAGLEALDRAVSLSDSGRFVATAPELILKTSDELRAELQRGIDTDASDLNPLRVFRTRK